MNIEMLDLFFTDSKCSLSAVRENITASLSILKSLWRDEKMLSTINEARIFFDQSIETKCMGPCEKCCATLLELFKRLDNVGLEQVFFNLLMGRQKVKRIFKNNKTRGKNLKKTTHELEY